MRIVDIRERSIAISRYADPAIPSGGLTTSLVAVITDATRAGKPVVGYGFSSIGRFAQGGLIRALAAIWRVIIRIPQRLGLCVKDCPDARRSRDHHT